MNTILSAQPWLEDPLVVQIPWRTVDETRKLRMGYMMDDGNVHLQPPLRSALEKVVSTLKTRGEEVGIELVEYKPWQHKEGLDIVRSLYFTDGGTDVRSAHRPYLWPFSCGSPLTRYSRGECRTAQATDGMGALEPFGARAYNQRAVGAVRAA